MFEQTEITYREAADRGMQQAIDHAERLDDTFPARAEAFIYTYARCNPEFTGEQMTAAAALVGVEPLSDGRAWGVPIKRAAAAGVMFDTGRTAPRTKGHGAPGKVWQSLVFEGYAA